MDIMQIYKNANALLEGHFLLSSGKHSTFYLQSAKVLENPKTAEELARALAEIIRDCGVQIDCVCSPALGGILAGYELARALGVRFIFTERVNGAMTLRRGFEVSEGERILVCEDIITTGGSAMEAAQESQKLWGKGVALAAPAKRGNCNRHTNPNSFYSPECQLACKLSLFVLAEFLYETYTPENCPLCKQGSIAIKPGSRGN